MMLQEELEKLARQSIAETDGDFGYYPGYRAAQAKGTLCRGVFKSTGLAGGITRAVQFQPGAVTPVTVRFSNAATNPMRHDGSLDVRSMAATFHLPDGGRTDILALRMSRFFVGTARQFLRWQRAMRRNRFWGLPRPGRWFFVYMIWGLPKLFGWRQLRSLCRVPSYASCRYNSLHAFRWRNQSQDLHHVRYSWVPEVPEERFRWWQLRWWRAPRRDPDYLRAELADRLDLLPVRFRLEVQVAAGRDRVYDPSAKWKKKRRRIKLGTLELTEAGTWETIGNRTLRFDPTRLTDGIELPEGDSLLMLRRYVYALSAKRRSGRREWQSGESQVVASLGGNPGASSWPDPEQRVRVNGVDICYQRSRDGGDRPLLLIMGFACPMTWWHRDFCHMLEQKGFRLIRFDNIDCGRSTHLDVKVGKLRGLLFPRRTVRRTYTVDDMANCVDGLLREIGAPSAHVMGISLGGMVAQALAIQHPKRVLSLTCINSSPSMPRWPPSRWPTLRVMRQLTKPQPTTSEERWVNASLPLWRLLNGGRLPPKEKEHVRGLLRIQWSWSEGVHPQADLRQMIAVLGSPDRREKLRKLKMPSLVIYGTEDPLIRPAGSEETYNAIPGARLLRIDGMGHYTPRDTWTRIIDAIDEVAAHAERG